MDDHPILSVIAIVLGLFGIMVVAYFVFEYGVTYQYTNFDGSTGTANFCSWQYGSVMCVVYDGDSHREIQVKEYTRTRQWEKLK